MGFSPPLSLCARSLSLSLSLSLKINKLFKNLKKKEKKEDRAEFEPGLAKSWCPNTVLAPSIGSVSNFSPRAPGPTHIHAWPYSDSQRASVFCAISQGDQKLLNLPSSALCPTTLHPAAGVIGAVLPDSGRAGQALRPGEHSRKNRWVPGSKPRCRRPLWASP